MESFSCTESNAGPIIDIIWGGLMVASAVDAANEPDACGYGGCGVIAFGASWGVLSLAAAPVGFNKSKKCRLAKQQWAQRQAQGRVAPQPQAEPAAGETVQAVVVSPQADTVSVGDRVQLAATAHSCSGATIPNRSFTWSSSNDAIASVSAADVSDATMPRGRWRFFVEMCRMHDLQCDEEHDLAHFHIRLLPGEQP